MPLFHIFILALVQGITEFLPVSSSGHLVLAHAALNGTGPENPAQDLLLDVAVHVGTLAAVLIYFRKDIGAMFCGLIRYARGKREQKEARLALYLFLGSLPVLSAGLALHLRPLYALRGVEIVAWTTLIFGILLWAVDARVPAVRRLGDLRWRGALFIGLAQVLALIPGTSRSGITMTAARWLGFTRPEAARYSLLLAIIAISGAGTLAGFDLAAMDSPGFTVDVLLAAFLAFAAGWAAIALMMAWLERATFTIFAFYRIVLGLGLLVLIYAGGL